MRNSLHALGLWSYLCVKRTNWHAKCEGLRWRMDGEAQWGSENRDYIALGIHFKLARIKFPFVNTQNLVSFFSSQMAIVLWYTFPNGCRYECCVCVSLCAEPREFFYSNNKQREKNDDFQQFPKFLFLHISIVWWGFQFKQIFRGISLLHTHTYIEPVYHQLFKIPIYFCFTLLVLSPTLSFFRKYFIAYSVHDET